MLKSQPTHSIFRRLVLGVGLVAIASSLLLLSAVILDYHLSYRDLETGQAINRAWHEVFEHVVLPALLFVVPAALAIIVVIRRALAPLEQAAQEMDKIQGHERGFRLSSGTLPVEVQPFAEAVNALLTRLDGTAAQHEAFASDVAHELRTPLALMKLEVEQIGGIAKERLSPDLNAMQRLVDQLLLLAQIKAVQDDQIPRETLSLNEIGRDCVAMLAPIVIRGGGSIEFEDDTGDVHVLGWREAISAAIRNLVENAVQASPPGSRIMVLAGPGAALQVRDEGAGVTPEQLEYLIRRNVRADHASGSGAGLGLAIVDQIMAAHGGFLQANPQMRQMALVFPPA